MSNKISLLRSKAGVGSSVSVEYGQVELAETAFTTVGAAV